MNDKEKSISSEDKLNEELKRPGETSNPEDRFTTQDLREIGELLSDSPVSRVDTPIKQDIDSLEGSPSENNSAASQSKDAAQKKTEAKDTKTDNSPEENKSNIADNYIARKQKVRNIIKSRKDLNSKENPESSLDKNASAASAKGDKNGPSGKNKNGKTKGLPRKNKPRTWTKTLGIFVGIVAILGAIGAGGIYLLYTANFTDISDTKYTPKENTIVYTADNVIIASIFSENRHYVSIEQVPQDLRDALIATEDSRFYTHGGVDYLGVLRALISNIIGGNSTGQGASTLTQQLSRLLYLPDIASESTFLDSLNRKFKEISISYQMEEKYTKDQILEMYLNEYYFGSAAYGIEAAAETYFGKNVSQLNLAESAMLAGLPQAPSFYEPNVNFEAAKARQKQVLERMVDAGYISQEQANAAYDTPITIIPWSENNINNQISPGYQDFVGKVIAEYAKAVAPNIMKERGLSEDEAISYARQAVASGGYKFYTTLMSSYQRTAIETVENSLYSFGYDQSIGYTAALVSVDRDGAVRTYYGGNENYSDIDMADSPRQPGSNIKPLYYSMGLETGVFSPGSILNDAPININGYSPNNVDGSYAGAISFSQSLVQSKNVTSVQIFNTLGTQAAVDWIKRFGFDTITDDDYNLAVALGGLTYGVKPYQMAAAFNTFNDGGVYNQAYFFERVTTSSGEPVIDKNQIGLVSQQIMSPTTASGMWGIMQQVVLAGTGTNAQCGLSTAGKTGTTDNQENLWFTGMTSNLTTSVWMGNLDYEVLGGGSHLPAAIYGSYLRSLISEGLIS